MAKINVNGETLDLEFDAGTPLLWVLREQAGLTGTKYGCGIAQCGACTVHIDGQPVRACTHNTNRDFAIDVGHRATLTEMRIIPV